MEEFSDWAPSFNLGVLWRAKKDWSFGAVYKSPQKVEGPGVSTRLPQTFGAGVAYHPSDRVRILADVDYITWSDFDSIPDDVYVRDDVLRLHLGGEYLYRLENDRAFFIRGGLMREDSNALYFDGPVMDSVDEALRRGVPKEDPKNHISVGFGYATEKYQVDLAVDQVLDGGTILILSMVHYF